MKPVTLLKPVDNDSLYEVINGQRVELRRTAFESVLASEVFCYLSQFPRLRELGRVFVEMLFLIDGFRDLQLRPNVAFVSYKRWPKGKRVPRTNAWEVVPNLAVEVVSTSNTAEEILAKIREYFQVGVELVWVVYPTEEQVYVYDSPTQLRILKNDQEMDGGNVLPGFNLPIAALFDEEASEQEKP